VLLIGGCGFQATQVSGNANNIAAEILPGDWEVVGETVILHFDKAGLPVSIANYGDPEDWRTNIVFGEPSSIEIPGGQADIVFEPGTPFIDADTGEAYFDATGTANNITAFSLPIPGGGSSTFAFAGTYDAERNELQGTIAYEIFYGKLSIYAEEGEPFTLTKVD
jgi:hypothetical protein